MNRYNVRMIMGNDKCTTVTTVEAVCAEDAPLAAEMKWTEISIQVLNVERADDSKYGFCEIHKDQELEDHCYDCNAVYCEACEYE
jgi:hypothetical protein